MAAAEKTPGRARSLWPREHGAYAQLGAPLVTALVLYVPTGSAVLLAIATCCAFLANEPLLVVLGHRGRRIREQQGGRAVRRLAIAGTAAAAVGATGLWLAPRDALAVAGLVAIPSAIMIALAWQRVVHSLVGEIVAAIALPGAAAPVAVASGMAPRGAIALWAGWSVGYACTVVAVHRVIARHRRPASWIDGGVVAILCGVTVAAVALAVGIPVAMLVVPLAAISTALALRPPAATRLRAIGVALVIASVASSSIAVALA